MTGTVPSIVARRIAVGALLAAIVAIVVVSVSGGGTVGYRFRLRLADADGLRSGSLVTLGGVPVGTVSVNLGAHDAVVVDATLDKGKGPIGRNAKVFIAGVNLLGQKQLQLIKGNLSDPAPSGYTIPADRVTASTDLDQVLGVLDPSTRMRLAILLGETGAALSGRGAYVSELLAHLPHTLSSATTLLDQLVGDNYTLADLVQHSDQLIGSVSSQRQHLVNLLDTLGQTTTTVAAERTALESTLARAPGTLATLQTFLAHLQRTTVPLGPAARYITAAAPSLNQTLQQVAPFQQAADPTLGQAIAAAPHLTQLATGATPVLRRATPTVVGLAALSGALEPLTTQTLAHSVDNLLATVQNWSRAVQFRDNLSHVFRGEAGVTAQTLVSLIDQLTTSTTSSGLRRGRRPAAKRTAAATPTPKAPAGGPGAGRSPAPANPVGSLLGGVAAQAGATAGSLLGGVSSTLNKVLHGAAGSASPTHPGSGNAGSSGGGLGNLLNYLLKP